MDPARGDALPLISRREHPVFHRHPRADIDRALDAMRATGARVVVRAEPFAEVAWATEDLSLAARWFEEHLP